MSSQGECYACGAPIRWVKLAPKFKPHPIDPKPSREHGTIHTDDQGRATILPKEHIEKARAARVELYVSHFATCPDAARMRRPTTPIPEPASPVRSLVLEPPQIPGARGKERPLTEGEIHYLEAVRASETSIPCSSKIAIATNTPEPAPAPPKPEPKNRAERRALARELTHSPESGMFAGYQDVMNGIAAAAGYDGPRDFHKLCDLIAKQRAAAAAAREEPPPKNRAERRARELACSQCLDASYVLTELAKAAGFSGGKDIVAFAEHLAKQRASAVSPADLEHLRQAVETSEAVIADLTAARDELRRRVAEPELGGEWLRELRALRTELETTGGTIDLFARDVLRELAGRLGYRLR